MAKDHKLDPEERQSFQHSRRKLLMGLGATGAASLAGCFGGDDDDSNGNGTGNGNGNGNGGEVGHVDQTLRVPSNAVAFGEELVNVNSWAEALETPPNVALSFMSWEMGNKHPHTNERIPGLVTEWEWSDTEMKATFHPDAKYSNGDPIDPADFAYSIRLWNLQQGGTLPHEMGANRLHEAVEDFEVDGNELILKSPNGYFANLQNRERTPPMFWESFYHEGGHWRHFHDFRDIAEDWWELTEEVGLRHPDSEGIEVTDEQQDRMADIQGELFNRVVPIAEATTTGPFKFDRMGEGSLFLEKHEGFPYADEINWDSVRIDYMPDDQTVHAALQSDSIDGANEVNTPPHIVEAFPDHIQPVMVPTTNVDVLCLNQHNPDLQNRNVRQALAYAINRVDVAENVHETARIPWSYQDVAEEKTINWEEPSDYQFVGDLTDSFNEFDQDLDAAEQLMLDAGFERDGDDMWLNPDGETFSFTISTASGNPVFEQTIASQLERFGVDVEILSMEGTAFDNSFWNGETEASPWVDGSWWDTGFNSVYHGSSTQDTWNNAFGLWPDQLEDAMEELDLEWDSDSGRIVPGDERQSYIDGDGLIEYHRDNDLPIFTYEWDTDLRHGVFNEWTAEEFEEEGVDPAWLDYFGGQLTLRLRVEAPPVGDWEGDLVEWPAPWLSVPSYRDPFGYEEGSEMEEQVMLARVWVHNYHQPMIPIARHVQQGFLNTRDWIVTDDYVQGPRRFDIGETVTTLNMQANPDGRSS